MRERVKEYLAALFRGDKATVGLRLLSRGGRSCKMLRERVARDLGVDPAWLKKQDKMGRHDSWFRRAVEEVVAEAGLLERLPRRPVTRELLALILTQDAAERQVQEEDRANLTMSGADLRQSLLQGLEPGKKKGPFGAAGPSFELLGVADVKRLNRLYDLPCRGVEFEDCLFVANAPGVGRGGPAGAAEAHFWSARKVLDKLSASFTWVPAIRELVRAERLVSDVELVFAGGAISASLRGRNPAWGLRRLEDVAELAAGRNNHFFGDLDCFFVSPSGDAGAATRLLDRLLEAFYDGGNSGVLFERCEGCTTVRWADNCERYQFVHRLYPSAAAVIGGFDLGICAVMLHEGLSRVSLTHLGAWCNALNMNIVDTSRRSTR